MKKFVRILVLTVLILQIVSLRIKDSHEQTQTRGSGSGSASVSGGSSSGNGGSQAGVSGSGSTGGQNSLSRPGATVENAVKTTVELNTQQSKLFEAWKSNLIPWTTVGGKDLSQQFDQQLNQQFVPKAKELIKKGKLTISDHSKNNNGNEKSQALINGQAKSTQGSSASYSAQTQGNSISQSQPSSFAPASIPPIIETPISDASKLDDGDVQGHNNSQAPLPTLVSIKTQTSASTQGSTSKAEVQTSSGTRQQSSSQLPLSTGAK